MVALQMGKMGETVLYLPDAHELLLRADRLAKSTQPNIATTVALSRVLLTLFKQQNPDAMEIDNVNILDVE